MQRKKKIDPDNPPTRPGDWVGATVVRPGSPRRPAKSGGIMFYIFRSSADSALFVVTDKEDSSVLPNCPGNGKWRLFKAIHETGQPRVGFSEAKARADIRKRGFHLVRIDVQTAEMVGATP
jgi:hypothetical protein